MSSARGFSLFELMAVIVVLAITAVFVLPRLSPLAFTGTSLQQSARELSRFIVQSSQLAARESEPYLLRYSPADNIVELVAVREEEGADTLPIFQFQEGVVLKNIQSYYRGVLPINAMQLTVSKQGYLEPALIVLEDDDEDAMTLQLAPFLGEIELHAGYFELDEQLFR